jgi:MFS family permease
VQQRLAIVLVFLPFVLGYYLSYLYRTIVALISADLTAELGISAAGLGLLTSAYFFTFALVQLPLGFLLDRYGPRRIQAALLLVAALGAALFGVGQSLPVLLLGRALIGVGVAAALMAGLKAIVLWFPKERVALINGWFVMLGALGAVTATAPAELLLQWTGWRGLFALLAVATAASAALIYVIVPEPAAPSTAHAAKPLNLKAIYADPRFWRVAPLSATCIGTAWAMQGLWAAPWLADVENLDQPQIIEHLFVMGAALCGGALLFGLGADRLQRCGLRPQTLLACVAIVFVTAQIVLIAGWRIPSLLVWAVIAGVGGATVLSYASLSDYFPREIAGQANAAMNILHIGTACITQYAIGFVIERWASDGAHYPASAYKTAFALNLAFQVAAFIWFAGRGAWALLGPGQTWPVRYPRILLQRQIAGSRE